MTNMDFNTKLINCITDNYNLIINNQEFNNNEEFNNICIILNNFTLKIMIYKNCEMNKKKFSRFLNYNYKLIEDNFNFNENISKTFEDSTHSNWNLLHIIIVSYISYLQNNDSINIKDISNNDCNNDCNNDSNNLSDNTDNKYINYKYMIKKIMNRIEERSKDLISDDENENENENEN